MENLDGIPDLIVEVTLAFVNAGGTDQIRNLIVARRADLLTDDADRVLAHLIERHRDNEQDLAHLRSRRGLLLQCREQGIEKAFSAKSLPPEKEEVALTFINTHEAGALKRFVQEHEQEVLSPETDKVIQHLSIQYRDDEIIQKMLRQKRELLEACRRQGIDKAFSKDIIEAPRDLLEAVGTYLMAGPVEQVRQILESRKELLLTDAAEELLEFMADAAGSAGDEKALHMRLRLDLLHRSRAAGIDAALDLDGVEALLGEPSKVRGDDDGGDGEGNEAAAAESELDEELRRIAGERDSISEADLSSLVERRPEFKTVIRNRVQQGSMIWRPTADRSGMEELLRAMSVAQSSGAWYELIPIAREALRKVTRESSPEIWAMIQFSLGTALSRTPHGDRAENLDSAIQHHKLAREVLQAKGGQSRPVWAMNEHHLALAYFQRVRGDHAENIEEALAIWRALIAAVPPEEAKLEWASSMGDVLRQRPLGNRAKNIEEAIDILQDTVARAEKSGDSYNGSRARIALGLAFTTRVQGDPADNIERGISYVNQGQQEIGFQGDWGSWANVQRSLAHAYENRKLGDPAANWRTASELLRQIGERCPKERFPEQWAENQLAMGSLELRHPSERTIAHALAGARLMESTLDVYTFQNYPDRWAKVQLNLGSVYAEIFAVSPKSKEYFDQAVAHMENSFRVYTREKSPQRWALLRKNLGNLYLRMAELATAEERPAMAEKAIEHFDGALEVVTADNPAEHLDILEHVSPILFRHQKWQKALHRYVDAMRASDQLLDSAHTEAGQLLGAASSDWLYGPAAYCLFRLNDFKASLLCLEWGKSRILTKALAVRDLDIAALPETEFERMRSLRHQARELQAQLRVEDLGPDKHAAVGRTLAQTRQQIEAAIAQVRESNPEFLRSRLSAEEIFDAVESPGALVIPLVTDEGTVVYILIKDKTGRMQFIHCSLDWLSRQGIAHILMGSSQEPGWVPQYRAWQKGTGTAAAWRAAARSGLASLWKYMMKLILETLETRLEPGAPIGIIPPGELSFFPFHVASEDGSGRGSLLDRYVVAYCPSIYALRASQRRSMERRGSGAAGSKPDETTFVAAVNPTGDLPYANAEMESLEAIIPPASLRLFAGESANLANLRNAIGTGTHLHFACHGVYDSQDIMRSGLVLAGSIMTMGEILGPDIELSRARLVILSACETGLIDVKDSPDEFIGLPAAFLEGGACGVVSTLWPVMDRATALLMARFYESHLVEKLAPASALRQAQLWLRDATREEISAYYRGRKNRTEDTHNAYLEVILGGPPDERPYQDPYYWGAFQFTGA